MFNALKSLNDDVDIFLTKLRMTCLENQRKFGVNLRWVNTTLQSTLAVRGRVSGLWPNIAILKLMKLVKKCQIYGQISKAKPCHVVMAKAIVAMQVATSMTVSVGKKIQLMTFTNISFLLLIFSL